MTWRKLIDTDMNIDSELFERYMNSAITSTVQTEFYNDADEQLKKLLELHKEMAEKQREVYALSLLLPINDISKQLAIYTLTQKNTASKEQNQFENRVILTSLNRMQTNRAYKVFSILKQNKVNNTRTRFLAKSFLKSRRNIDFEAVKYRAWMKILIKHNHIKPFNNEVFNFLFDKSTVFESTHEIFNDYIKAKSDVNHVYKLPLSVALGFKEKYKIDDEQFYEKMKGQMTKHEKLRVQNTASKSGVKIETDLSTYEPVRLLKSLRALDKMPADARNQFYKSCDKVIRNIPFRFKNVKVVIDNSQSMYGSRVKQFHPISVAEACAAIFLKISDNCEVKAIPNKMKFLTDVKNESKLYEGVLEALESKPELLVIISDGYENTPAGMTNEVIQAYKSKIDKENKTFIVHINPVFAAESKDVRKLSELIYTVGIRDMKQLYLILLLMLLKMKNTKQIQKEIEKLKRQLIEINN